MRKKRLSTVAFVATLGSVMQPSNTLFAASSQYTSHYARGCQLYNVGRWIDARQEFLAAQALVGVADNFMQQKIDYALAQCAIKLELYGCEELLTKFDKVYPQAPYTNDILFMLGIFNASNDNLDEALRLLSEVDPNRLDNESLDEYNIRMGYFNFAKSDYVSASQYLDEIDEESEFYHHALYCKSYIAYVNGDYELARDGFEDLILDDAYAPVAPYYLLQVEFLMGNYDRALSYGDKLLESSEGQEQIEVIRTLSEANFRLGQYNDAVTLMNQYIASNGEVGREENYIKGFSLHQLGLYEEAIEPLRAVCGVDDALTQNASFHLANCYLHTGDKVSARKAFSMASNENLNAQIAEEALFNYAKLQYELGDGAFNETINILTRYVNTYDNPERLRVANTLLVAAYYNTRDYSTAYEAIGSIKNPDSEIRAAKQKITYLRGLESFIDGDYVSAKDLLEESIDIGITVKQVALASYWLGEIAFISGDYREAIDKYNYFIARAPKGDTTAVEARYNLAYSYLMLDDKDSALRYFNEYVVSQGGEDRLKADAYSRIGDINYSARSFNSATQNYDKTVSIGGEGSNYAKYQKAIIKGIQGSYSAKIAELESITQPEEGEAYLDDALYELGRTYLTTDDFWKSIIAFKNFQESYPSSPMYAQSLSDLGVAYTNVKKPEEAINYYDKAIKAAPQSQIAKDAMQGIREIYVGQGDAQAYFDYAESIGMEGDLTAVSRDSLSFASARGLYFVGDNKSEQTNAATALKRYIAEYPNGYYLSDALFLLSDCYIKTGDNKSAINTLITLSNKGQNQYSERVYDRLSKMTYEAAMYKESAEASRKLFDIAKDRDARLTAISRYIESTVLIGDSDAILAMSSDVISLGEQSVGVSAMLEAKYARATILRTRGERGEALVIYDELAKSDSKHKSEATYYVIDDKYRTGDRDLAQKMIFEFSEQPSTDSYWLAKSFILLGDIYAAEDDNFQARATYQSIVDGYANQSDGIIDDAKSKINGLN